jgi:hypothetical protein
MYGMGFSYSELLDDFFYDNSKNNIKDIQTDILNHVFDIIIYGSIYDNTESLIINLPLYDFVSTHYSHSDVILLCGDDENTLKNNQIEDFIKKKNVVFLRECSYDKL